MAAAAALTVRGCRPGSRSTRKLILLANRYRRLGEHHLSTLRYGGLTDLTNSASKRRWCELCSRNMSSSALYDSPNFRHSEEDLETKLKDMTLMDKNIKARCMEQFENVNVYKLSSKLKQLQNLSKIRRELEAERQEITNSIKHIVVNKLSGPDVEKQKQSLRTRGRAVKESIKAATRDFEKLEERVVSSALKLPNDLHGSVPEKEDEILDQCGTIPEFKFNIKDHLEIGRQTRTIVLSDVTQGSYYLRGRLAECEQALVATAIEKLDALGLMPVSCPGMVKSVILEGSGRDLDYPENIFTLTPRLGDQQRLEQGPSQDEEDSQASKWDVTYHLTGVSPMAFAAFMTKMNIAESSLPFRAYTMGRYYSRRNMKNFPNYGLFAAPQAMNLELCSVGRDKPEADQLYEEMVDQIWGLHKSLDLPLRLVNLGPANLRSCEQCKTEVQMWLPSQEQFLPVAWASIYGDYLSRRLVIRQSPHSNLDLKEGTSHIHTVHGTGMCVARLLAAYMENTQTQMRKYSLPTLEKRQSSYIITDQTRV